MSRFNILSKELAEALEISEDRLYEICEEFDADPDDDWELEKGIHYEPGPVGSRIFSSEGAIEICNYLEVNIAERPLLTRFKRWLLRRDRNLKGLMIRKRVHEASDRKGQLVFQSGRAFLAPRACREVLGLGKRQDILKRTFKEIQRCTNTEIEPLVINEDFFEGEEPGKEYFSSSGLAALGKQLGTRLTQKHRQEWVKVVAEYAPKALTSLEAHERGKEKHIRQVMDRVRKEAKRRCQLTGRRQQVHKFDLEVHHLYDRMSYPQFADREANLIPIASDIHTHFHQWMGGPKVSCTVEDMEKYIEEFGNSLFSDGDNEQASRVLIRLSEAKRQLRPLL